MSQPPDPLDYASPASDDPSFAREKACRYLRRLGYASFLFGLCCCSPPLGNMVDQVQQAFLTMSPVLLVLGAETLVIITLSYIACGFLHVKASQRIAVPNPKWEKLTIRIASVNLYTLVVTNIAIPLLAWSNGVHVLSFLEIPFGLGYIAVLTICIRLLQDAGREAGGNNSTSTL